MSRRVPLVLFAVFASATAVLAVSWAASFWTCYRISYFSSDGSYLGFESFPHTLIVYRCVAWYRMRDHQPPVPSEFSAERVPTFRIRHDNVRTPPGFLGFASAHTLGADQKFDAYWIPDWFAFLSSGLLALAASRPLRRVARTRRRLKLGLCAACGYDLRASAGRCPECGTERTTGPDAFPKNVAPRRG